MFYFSFVSCVLLLLRVWCFDTLRPVSWNNEVNKYQLKSSYSLDWNGHQTLQRRVSWWLWLAWTSSKCHWWCCLRGKVSERNRNSSRADKWSGFALWMPRVETEVFHAWCQWSKKQMVSHRYLWYFWYVWYIWYLTTKWRKSHRDSKMENKRDGMSSLVKLENVITSKKSSKPEIIIVESDQEQNELDQLMRSVKDSSRIRMFRSSSADHATRRSQDHLAKLDLRDTSTAETSSTFRLPRINWSEILFKLLIYVLSY